MSIIATAVKHLMAAGVTGEALLAAIADMEAQVRLEPKERSSGAIRQERYRRNKASQVTECDASDVTPPLSPSPLLSPHTPQITPHPHTPVNNKPARGTRLPVDWQPKPLSDECQAIASRWQAGVLERELSKFRDWAASASGPNAVKKDWDAAWRNWIRNAEERHGTANRTNRENTSAGQRPAKPVDGFTAALRRVANGPVSSDGRGVPSLGRMGGDSPNYLPPPGDVR